MTEGEGYTKVPPILRVRPIIKWGSGKDINPGGNKRENDMYLTVGEGQRAR